MKAKTSLAMMTAAVALLHSTFAETPDAFVEYVDSNRSQYIDTGIVGRCGTSADMTVQWLDASVDSSFLSSRVDGNDTRFILCSNQGPKTHYYMAHRSYNDPRDISKSEYRKNAPDRIVSSITHDGAKVKYTMSVNGAEEINVEREEEALNTQLNMYLFAQNKAGSADLKSGVRCYSVKIWQDGNLVRDFLPCVKSGRAGLYDDVSKAIFYPQGGELAAGPALKSFGKPDHYVQYVESDGTQYVDTEVVGKCNTSADMTIQWQSTAVDSSFLSSRENSTTDTRFVLCSNQGGWAHYYMAHRTFVRDYNKTDGTGRDVSTSKYSTTVPDRIESSITHNGENVTYTMKVNGNLEINQTRKEEALNTNLNMYLFAQNNTGAVDLRSPVRFFGTKIWQDGNLVRDFRPCIKDGRAGLYDEVSGWIFFPQGGDLTYPNEKPDKIMKWVNLTGSSYVDTQVRAKSGIRSEMQYRPSVDNIEDQYLLAARNASDTNTRFLLGYYYNYNGNYAAVGYKDSWQRAKWSGHLKDKTHTLVSEISAKGVVSGVCDGDAITGSTEYGEFDTGLNLYMFGINIGGKAQDFFNGRSYYSKIWVWDESANDYVPVRDFVPCVKDDKVAFYDNVSQTMFYPFPAIPAEGNSQPRQGLIITFY